MDMVSVTVMGRRNVFSRWSPTIRAITWLLVWDISAAMCRMEMMQQMMEALTLTAMMMNSTEVS